MPEFHVAIKGSRGVLGGLFLLSSLSTTGCMFSTAKPAPRVFRPPPVQVQPVVEAEIFIEESGPELEFEGPENPAEIATLRMPEFPAPPKPTPRPPPPKLAPQPEPAIPNPPKITQLFTPDQRKDMSREYAEVLNTVARDLNALSKKRLSTDQTSQAARIRIFREQADEQFKRDDLVTALELAKRALSLAEDLVSRVR